MDKLKFWLLSSSTVVSSLALTLLSEQPSQAKPMETKTSNQQQQQPQPQANLECSQTNCSGNSHLASYLKTFNKSGDEFSNLEKTPEGHLILEISDEESEAAINLFGCDCITSVNAVRQMRGIAIGVEGDQILPGPTIKPCALQRAPEIPN